MAIGLIPPGEKVDPVTSWIPIVEELREIELEDLVPGDWVTTEFGIQPGPDVGSVLRCLRDAEIQGLVTNGTEARAYLREYHQNRD